MAILPFSGDQVGYDAPSLTAGVGMTVAGAAGVEEPLVFRMMENLPTGKVLFFNSMRRGSNTLISGGRAPKFFSTTAQANDYFGSGKGFFNFSKRAQNYGGGAPSLRPGLRNFMFGHPKNFNQYTDLSVFADPSYSRYTPFGGGGMIFNSRPGRKLIGKLAPDLDIPSDKAAVGPGTFSGISAATKIERIERKALAGNQKAIQKLMQVDKNIMTLNGMNNLDANLANYNPIRFNTYGPQGNIGARSNALVSAMPGQYTQYLGGYFQGAKGFGAAGGFTSKFAQEGAEKAASHMAQGLTRAFGAEGFTAASGAKYAGVEGAEKLLAKGLFKEMGAKGISQLAMKGGSKAALAVGARAVGLAIPGVQVVMAAKMVYDLGKMAGEVIKGGINLAKDAGKSLKGSIEKSTFGLGYKDTEVAATSRARGVMAIQNSRLNARSLLGGEASMMAAHYG